MGNSKLAKRKNDYTIFRSKDGTIPYNQLSEVERISEGSRQPYAIVNRDEFVKSPKERETLARLRRKAKNQGTGASISGGFNPVSRVTVHLKNNRASNFKMDKCHFPTTHTFNSRNPDTDAFLLADGLHTQVTGMYVNGKKTK